MNSIIDALAKLRRLTGRERALLLQAWLLLLLADLALRALPFSFVLRYCRRPGGVRGNPAADPSLPALRVASLVEKAGRYCPAGTSCLKEALVLSHLLARRGVPTRLRIGVGRQAEAFAAHAWLEQDGRVILGGKDLDAFARLL